MILLKTVIISVIFFLHCIHSPQPNPKESPVKSGIITNENIISDGLKASSIVGQEKLEVAEKCKKELDVFTLGKIDEKKLKNFLIGTEFFFNPEITHVNPSPASKACVKIFFPFTQEFDINSLTKKFKKDMTLWVGSEEKIAQLPRNGFRVFPSLNKVSHSLVQTLENKKFNSVWILIPKTSNSSLGERIKKKLAETKISVRGVLLYDREQYSSMEYVAQKVLQIDPEQPKNMIATPIQDFDGIILLDDFRIVRHFQKIFKFLGARKINFIGHFAWRGKGLIDPPDHWLTGSFFVDYMGQYQLLPNEIKNKLFSASIIDPFFVDPRIAQDIDYQLIGYRLGEILKSFYAQPGVEQLENLKMPVSSFFPEGKVFNADREIRWPSFIYEVNYQKLEQAGMYH